MNRILTIRRNKSDNKAIGYTWCKENQTKEDVQKLIDDWNHKYPQEYYEICENEDLINLLPLPRRRYDCEDIMNRLDDVMYEVRDIQRTIDDIFSECEQAKSICEKLGDYGDD